MNYATNRRHQTAAIETVTVSLSLLYLFYWHHKREGANHQPGLEWAREEAGQTVEESTCESDNDSNKAPFHVSLLFFLSAAGSYHHLVDFCSLRQYASQYIFHGLRLAESLPRYGNHLGRSPRGSQTTDCLGVS